MLTTTIEKFVYSKLCVLFFILSLVVSCNIENNEDGIIANFDETFKSLDDESQVSGPNIVTDQILAWFDYQSVSGNATWIDKAYQLGYTSEAMVATFEGNATTSSINNQNTIYLDGSANTYILLRNDNLFTWDGLKTSGSGWSIETWIRSDGSWIHYGQIWSALHNAGIRLRVESQKLVYPYIKGGSPTVLRPTMSNLAEDTWIHVATTYNDSTGAISTYLNGSLIDSSNNGWSPDSWLGSRILIGATNYSSTSYLENQKMYVGAFRIYAKELSASEVQNNYNEDSAYLQ